MAQPAAHHARLFCTPDWVRLACCCWLAAFAHMSPCHGSPQCVTSISSVSSIVHVWALCIYHLCGIMCVFVLPRGIYHRPASGQCDSSRACCAAPFGCSCVCVCSRRASVCRVSLFWCDLDIVQPALQCACGVCGDQSCVFTTWRRMLFQCKGVYIVKQTSVS